MGFLSCTDTKCWATEETRLQILSALVDSYHRKHFRELRSGAGEHRRHDEVQERHQLQEVVLQGSSCQQQAMLGLQTWGGGG